MTFRFEQVGGSRDLADFLALTGQVYGQDPRYIPALHQQIRSWFRGEVPGVSLHVLRDGTGKAAARTTLHTSPDFDAKLGRPLQLFGLTEFTDSAAVSKALFDAICSAGQIAGKSGAFGPVSLLPNQAGGVITSGYDDRGFIDSAWNYPYYPAAYESYGFARRFESDTWICPLTEDPDEIFAFDDTRLAAEKLELHHGDKKRVAEQLPILREMLNASFAQLGYYTEISAEQLARQTDGLAYLLDESLLLYLTKAGQPVAFVLCLPDISEFVAAAHGDLNPLRQIQLLARRHRYRRDAVLIIKGTIPDEQGHGYMRLLSRELLRNLRANGYRTLRSTYVERTNPGSAAQYLQMRGRPLHGYTFYEKELT
jgi:GNAT superfamily N-acetyltransferase